MTTSLLPVRSGTSRSRSGGDPAGATRRRPSGALISWLFLIPAILLAVWFKFIPMIEGVRLSLFKVQPFLGNEWVGLDNYTDVLTDARFREALGHTLILGIGQTVGALIVGALLALLLEGQTRSLWVLRSAVFLPVVTATAVSGEIWRLIYHPTPDGPLNSLLSLLGLGPSQFIAGTDTALWSVMAVGVWIGAPYNMVIVLAGLAGVDRALYESASVDGAGTLRRLWHITVPALRPAIAVILTLAAIRSLRTFTEVYVLTGGGPAGSTEVWMTRVISLGLEENNIGRASAASVLLLLLTLTATLAVRFATRKKEA
ncbi:putative ABC transporter permease protein [Actinoplanes missouriensis 431]|uniref:Putative ABC transporter permease protein n=1 Tax=Actinoplanes missouriensis (strain ATCC 14538 / DSM 43046 / CBS 188.64 / JCM 3121 / NBRC 102363 / NCIMB 12654 / NRRL B-3342 / UNCC 431) TaxID=512565 RepID=I0HDX2_ACTM4|nr:sugar ABC transporter permease [Actinoplanes missouriensis]BAL91209.1 putative ABC transporter permease protein [Actinoplanes missouriensis 431]